MNFLAKYNKLVLSCIVAFFAMMLINHIIFTMQEGLENPPAATATAPAKPAVAAVPSEQQKASAKTINELQTEMATLQSELTTLQQVVSLNQSKVDALKARIQSKQTEIDTIQNKVEVDNLATTATA
jgi:peptidoglycan hydrolase CwlO-like protein